MQALDQDDGLADRVYQAILDDILDGTMVPGQHLVQEQLAAELNVSRQPIQQAMALLKADGVVEKVGRRGLAVAPLDVDRMRHHYDLRGLIDGYAARQAADRVAGGMIEIAQARQNLNNSLRLWNSKGEMAPLKDQVLQDEQFHRAIYEMSGNPIVLDSVRPHWRFLRRAMADVLRHAEPPAAIWQQHAAISEAVLLGKPDMAADLSIRHTRDACNELAEVLEALSSSSNAAAS